MTKFEYKVVGIDIRHAESELNKLGMDGWEVMGFTESSSVMRVVLKRIHASEHEFMAGI